VRFKNLYTEHPTAVGLFLGEQKKGHNFFLPRLMFEPPTTGLDFATLEKKITFPFR
jgi:hypothetical protein